MGNSIRYWSVYQDPSILPCKPLFEALQLHYSAVGRLHEIFRAVDIDNSGTIELNELLNFLNVDRSPFRNRVFQMCDEDHSNSIDFREFVLAMWNYCTLSRHTLELFAFDLYDTDSSGELSIREIHRLLKDLYGKQYMTSAPAKDVAAQLESVGQAKIFNLEQFHAFVQTKPALLYPAFQLQQQMRRAVLGEQFWEKMAQKRIRLSVNQNKFITIASVSRMNVSINNLTERTQGIFADISEEDKFVIAILRYTGTHFYRVKAHESNRASEYAVYDEREKIEEGLRGKGKFRREKVQQHKDDDKEITVTLRTVCEDNESERDSHSRSHHNIKSKLSPSLCSVKPKPEPTVDAVTTQARGWNIGGKFSAIYASKAEEHYENTFGDYHRLHSEVAKAANSRVVFLTPDGHKPAKVFPADVPDQRSSQKSSGRHKRATFPPPDEDKSTHSAHSHSHHSSHHSSHGSKRSAHQNSNEVHTPGPKTSTGRRRTFT